MSDPEVPAPTSVLAYLRATGWEPADASETWAHFTRRFEREPVMLRVALVGHAPDYPRRVGELVADLGRLEGRSHEALLRDIRTSATDLLRIRLAGIQHGGRIPVELGAWAFWCARDLLLAAACATVEPRAVFSGIKPRGASEYLDRVQFGPTEAGSFVLTVESAVPPCLVSGHGVEDVEEPFDRAVGLTLARATAATRRILDRVAVTGSSEALGEGVAAGVSANLCDAIAGLVQAGNAHDVELSFRWAPVRPPKAEPIRAVRFGGDAAPYLREMARALRERAPVEESEIVGPIYKVTSRDPETGGEITVHTVEPVRDRKIRIRLAGPAYQEATRAHANGHWVACVGELDLRGRVLASPRRFRVLRPGGAISG